MKLPQRLLAAVAAAATLIASTPAAAFPTRPITIYMPYTAGTGLDVMVRLIAKEAAPLLGQAIVVENRSGGLVRLGFEAMKRAPADGHTLSITSDSLSVIQPLVDPSFQFEAGKDYQPVTFLYSFPLVLAARANLPPPDMKALVEYARSQPGKVTIAGGTGSIGHTAAVRLQQVTKTSMMFVPYRDAGPATPDLMAGRIDLMLHGFALRPAVTSGTVKAYATTGRTRWDVYPELPTLKELGIDMVAEVWIGLIAPAGTPAEAMTKLDAAFRAALKTEVVRKRMTELGMTTGPATTSEFQSFIQSEKRAWEPAIRSANIQLK